MKIYSCVIGDFSRIENTGRTYSKEFWSGIFQKIDLSLRRGPFITFQKGNFWSLDLGQIAGMIVSYSLDNDVLTVSCEIYNTPMGQIIDEFWEIFPLFLRPIILTDKIDFFYGEEPKVEDSSLVAFSVDINATTNDFNNCGPLQQKSK